MSKRRDMVWVETMTTDRFNKISTPSDADALRRMFFIGDDINEAHERMVHEMTIRLAENESIINPDEFDQVPYLIADGIWDVNDGKNHIWFENNGCLWGSFAIQVND